MSIESEATVSGEVEAVQGVEPEGTEPEGTEPEGTEPQEGASVTAEGDAETVGDRDNWAVLVDPGWVGESEEEPPPAAAMVGGWPLDAQGRPGKFEPNPDFVPSSETVPSDPSDAVLRLLARGEGEVDELIPTLRDGVVEVAVSEEGQLLVGPAPDDAPCVAVVTAPFHRTATGVEHWAPITVDELAELLPSDTDILLNPNGPASMRLLTTALREAIAGAPAPTPDQAPTPDPAPDQAPTPDPAPDPAPTPRTS